MDPFAVPEPNFGRFSNLDCNFIPCQNMIILKRPRGDKDNGEEVLVEPSGEKMINKAYIVKVIYKIRKLKNFSPQESDS